MFFVLFVLKKYFLLTQPNIYIYIYIFSVFKNKNHCFKNRIRPIDPIGQIVDR